MIFGMIDIKTWTVCHSSIPVIPPCSIFMIGAANDGTGIAISRFLTAFGMTFAFVRGGVEESSGFAAAFLYIIIIRPVIPSSYYKIKQGGNDDNPNRV